MHKDHDGNVDGGATVCETPACCRTGEVLSICCRELRGLAIGEDEDMGAVCLPIVDDGKAGTVVLGGQ